MKLRTLPIIALLTAACGTTPGGQDGTEGETGEPEPLEPACELVWEWALRVDGLDTPYPAAYLGHVDVDAAGNVYVVTSHGSGTDQIIWIGQWASDGSQGWSRTLGEPGLINSGRGVRVGLDGELFVLGSLGPQMWLARLDPTTGDELWSDTVDDVQAADIGRTASGQIIVLGEDRSMGGATPWLSERSPIDGAAAWTRTQAIMLDGDRIVDDLDELGVSDTGELRVFGGWSSTIGQPSQPPETGALLLRFDALGELLDVTLPEPGDDWRALVLDGSPDTYLLRSVGDVDTLTSLDAQLGERWSTDASAWAIGEQPGALEIIGLRGDTLEIGGTIDRTDEGSGGGQASWTATVERETGVVTRRCAHEVVDADSGVPMRQQTRAAVSHPSGGMVVLGEQSAFDPMRPGEQTSAWIWLRHFAG